MMYSFQNFEPVCCFMSGSDFCFLTCIQVSQEARKVVWYSHLLKNFPQFVVIHTVKAFNIVNEAEVDVLLGFSCFFYSPTDVGYLISGSWFIDWELIRYHLFWFPMKLLASWAPWQDSWSSLCVLLRAEQLILDTPSWHPGVAWGSENPRNRVVDGSVHLFFCSVSI